MARAKIGLAVLVLALSGCPLLEVDEGDVGNSLQWQDPPASEMNFDAAESYCEDLEQGGHDDWRLPSIDELRTLVDGCSDTMPNGACAVGSECLDDSCSQSACSYSGGNDG